MAPDIMKLYEIKAQIDQVLQLTLGLYASVEALMPPEKNKRFSNQEMISEFRRLTKKRRAK